MVGTQRHFSAKLFDGRTTFAHAVQIEIQPGEIEVLSLRFNERKRYTLRQLKISDPLDSAPMHIALPEGATIEVPRSASLEEALFQLGYVQPWPSRAMNSSAMVGLAFLFTLWLCYFGYSSFVPAAGESFASALPDTISTSLASETLMALDRGSLRPSSLPATRQQQISQLFAQLQAGLPGKAVKLHFRSAQTGNSINALSLPGRQIVLLDGLVSFVRDDMELMAVLAHELGHVQRHHLERKVFQAAGAAAISALLWGDYSGLATYSASWLAIQKYSRGNELQADRDAIRILDHAGFPSHRLEQFLARIHREKGQRARWDVVSSHPSLEERIELLRVTRMQHETLTPDRN